ncbi:MAG: hypothetical protein KBD31_00020 [Proteobacteria bacterium]|nr:hypothetical protein [Pseudomonadota bacterium]
MHSKTHKQVTSDGKVKASVNIDPEVLNAIDLDRKKNGLTRSGWITVACLHFLKRSEGEQKVESK